MLYFNYNHYILMKSCVYSLGLFLSMTVPKTHRNIILRCYIVCGDSKYGQYTTFRKEIHMSSFKLDSEVGEA